HDIFLFPNLLASFRRTCKCAGIHGTANKYLGLVMLRLSGMQIQWNMTYVIFDPVAPLAAPMASFGAPVALC
ncbi:MAG: hypothetical protein ABSG04_11955, partial [Verrucomicrobiota bacterium]